MKRVAVLGVAAAILASPAAVEAREVLTKHEAAAQIRKWGRNTADENGDTITRQNADLCSRSSLSRVVCWYEEDGYDVDGADYSCWGTVRVIKYETHYTVGPIKHGRFRFRCY